VGGWVIARRPRYISAAEVSLLLLLETVLGPVWVYWFLGERPSATALWAGGGLILVLAWHSAVEWVQRGRTQHQGTSTVASADAGSDKGGDGSGARDGAALTATP
jgi:hypothetical protein